MVDINDKLFWTGRQHWPVDAYGYTFLGRAVAQLGKELFPTDWTGAEMVAEEPYPRSVFYIDGIAKARKPLFGIAPELLDVLARVLRENHPEVDVRYASGPSRRPVLTEEQHMAALLTIERVNPLRLAARARAAKVTGELGAALRDGKIKYALLPKRGGEFIADTKPFWWNIPSAAHRWKRCQMSPKEPYSIAFAGDDFMHIFVDGADLSYFLSQLSNPNIGSVTAMPQLTSLNDAYQKSIALPQRNHSIADDLAPDPSLKRRKEADLTPTEVQIREVLAVIAAKAIVPSKPMDRNSAIRREFVNRGWSPPSVRTIERFIAKAARNSDN